MSVNFSLQKRLALSLALVLVLVCQWLVVSFIIHHVTQEYMVSRLTHDAENLLANLEFSPDAPPELNPARVDPIYTQPWSGHYYQIRLPTTTLRSRSLWDGELVVPHGVFAARQVEVAPGPQGQSVLMVSRSYYKQRQHMVITLAEEMTNINREIALLQVWYAVISSGAIGLLLFLQRRVVRHALKPLDAAREEVSRLQQGEQGSLSVDAVPVEIVPFLTAINRLFSLLTQRLEKSRHAAGNMAHAIKTPLTVLLQLIAAPELDAFPQLRERIIRQVDAIRALTGRELKKVRLAGSDAPALRVDVALELRDLVEVMQRVHRGRGLVFDVEVPLGVSAMVDREDLLELSGNLLDNACKWAAGRVRLSVRCDRTLRIQVEDDGPGCAPEHYQQILQRGGRVDESRQGHGIGLAVIREIVTDYGGELELGRSQALGGFSVRVDLPLKGLSCGKEGSR